MEKTEHAAEPGSLPKAKVKKRHWPSPFWLAPILALAFVGWLVYRDIVEYGPTITIRFKQGKGIEVGKTMLRYRGVKVGKVTSIGLSKDHKWVEVKASLDATAKGIARDGSEFWIVHPEVTGAEIRGLRTIVSGDFIQVRPGKGAEQTKFMGLEDQPVVTEEQDGLSLILLTSELKSVEGGSPVLYRGVQVGEVIKYELGKQAQAIEIYVHIQKRFASLVRKNSKFWSAGGINVNLSLLGGADISAESFKTLLGGGVAFATPTQPDEPVASGTTFRLYDNPEKEWQNWFPALNLPEQRSPKDEQARVP